MNVIQRICEKYPIEYSLMPDLRMRSVSLSFGTQVPDALQDRILEGLDWLGVYVEELGMPMSLDVSQARPDSYTLFVSGREMFHFSAFTGIAFAGYDIVEAVIWTIYIQAGHKNWLDPYQGKYISCRSFSSRQQAAAARINSSVARQFQSDFSQDQLLAVFEKLRSCVAPFVSQAPRFSAQPIEESVFEKCKGMSAEGTLQEIAVRLFGSKDYRQEQKAYCRLVQGSNAYRNQLEEAVRLLVKTAYQIPIMAVSNMFIGMGTLINEIENTESGDFRRLLQERVKFTLSAAYLRNCFEKVDKAYRDDIRMELETAFLRAVCEKANAQINQEFTKAKRSIRQLWNALGRFCFVHPDSFEGDNGAGSLSWKQLDDLMDRDVFSENVFWTPDSLNDLQSVIQSAYAPQLWICSEKLRNQSELASITDIMITQPAPVMDDRLVWGIWVDV